MQAAGHDDDDDVGKVVGKATRDCVCCMANIGIRC